MEYLKTVIAVASGQICNKCFNKMGMSKFVLLLISLDFTHIKTNNRTVPNKKVWLGMITGINNRTAYDYFDS